jgi:xanthine dehydrogenase accessory factor
MIDFLSETNIVFQMKNSRGRIKKMTQFFHTLSIWEKENRDFVLATVIDTGGSTPRQTGTQLAIRIKKDQKIEMIGTVGGGAFEKFVIDSATDLLSQSKEKTKTIEIHLTQQLAMCCGGKMTAFLNKITAKPHIIIAGAGHVGSAIAQFSQMLEYPTLLIDERKEWANPQRFPQCDPGILTIKCENIEEELQLNPPSAQDYIVVATHDHALDERLIALLAPKRYKYLGLIGSQHKWLKFKKRLMAIGVSESDLDLVHCPVGLKISAQSPAEIAVSILAQMIQIFQTNRESS